MKIPICTLYIATYIGYLVVAPVALILASVKFFADSPADWAEIFFVAFGGIIFVVFAVAEY